MAAPVRPPERRRNAFRRTLLYLAVATATTLTAAPALAIDAGDLARRLPRVWCGQFVWHVGGAPQRYRVVFNRVVARPDGSVLAVGIGINLSSPGRPTRVTFRASIEAATLRLTMRESNPTPPSPTYIVEGRFVGEIDATLDRIEALWIDARPRLPNARLILEGGDRRPSFPHCVDRVS